MRDIRKVLPILFNSDMVRAILDGRKTVTRRKIDIDIINNCDMEKDGTLLDYQNEYGDLINVATLCRYQPGDILYVRETFGWEPCWDCGMDTEDHKGCYEEDADKIYNHDKLEWGCYCYKASCEDNVELSVDTWHPSIHMPKAIARIWLKVKNVRVERLRDISEEQVKAEGIHFCESSDVSGWTWKDKADIKSCKFGMFSAFKALWNSTIKDKDRNLYGFEANPFVWVIEFERCEKPEKEDDERCRKKE